MGSTELKAGAVRLGLAWLMTTTALTVLPMAGAAAAEATAQAEQARPFDIPAQPLAQALQAFARQAGLNVTADTVIVAGIASPGAQGTMTTEQALRRMLSGSGLVWRFTSANAVTLERAPSGAIVLDPVTVEAARSWKPGTAQVGDPPPAYPGGQVGRGGQVGMLGNRDMMDTPLSTSSYTQATIENRKAVTVADVLEYDPSVRNSSSKGGILDAFFVRGYPIGEGNLGEIAFNGLFGVAPNYRVFADYAERIEVVKGPAALLYGLSPNSGVGGTINIVPKRAPDEDLNRVTGDFAAESQLGGGLDIARRFGPDKAIGIRFNGSYDSGDTALDKQTREAMVGALALDYRGEKVRASLDVLDQKEDLNAPLRPFLVTAGIPVPSAPDGSRNVFQSWSWSEIEDRSVQARGEYDITDHVTLFASAGGGRTVTDRMSEQVATIQNAAGNTTSTVTRFQFEIDREVYEGGARARFETGAVGHAVALQASTYRDLMSRGSNTSATAVTSNLYAPLAQSPQFVAAPSTVPKISENRLSGISAADTLSILDERVQLTLGARLQQINTDNFSTTSGAVTSSYDQSEVTPMIGLVVKPLENVSLYVNYIEGLSKGDTAPAAASNSGQTLAPYVAKQKEIGAKVDFGRVAATLSLFEIEKPFGQLEGGVYTSGGQQRNRGIELGLFGEISSDLRVLGGLTLFDAELTRTNNANTKGNQPVGVPDLQANFGLEWDPGVLRGLTLGGAVVHTGEQHVDTANNQTIPAWTRLDFSARYRTEVASTPIVVRAVVENLFDTAYWSGVAGSYGGLGLGAPRTVILSVGADF